MVSSDEVTNNVAISNDGVTWTLINVPAYTYTTYDGVTRSAYLSLYSVCWSSELHMFCAMANTSTGLEYYAISSDGTNWVIKKFPQVLTTPSICWSSELHMFCTNSYAFNTIITSTDGINWVVSKLPTNTAEYVSYAKIVWSSYLGIFVLNYGGLSLFSTLVTTPIKNNKIQNNINTSDGNVILFTNNHQMDINITTDVTKDTYCKLTFIITNGGAYNITWPTNITWNRNITPVLSTTGIDMLSLLTVDGGITWLGKVNGYNYKLSNNNTTGDLTTGIIINSSDEYAELEVYKPLKIVGKTNLINITLSRDKKLTLAKTTATATVLMDKS
jgi:hypothetical protein